jgi:hypothetical protein
VQCSMSTGCTLCMCVLCADWVLFFWQGPHAHSVLFCWGLCAACDVPKFQQHLDVHAVWKSENVSVTAAFPVCNVDRINASSLLFTMHLHVQCLMWQLVDPLKSTCRHQSPTQLQECWQAISKGCVEVRAM